jgi:hydroxymethylpyrimidine/phosphomethylpyrimidine kinase
VTADTHGTGCTYSAAIATGLAFGWDVAEAVAQAKRYITEAVRHAWRLGGGHGPTNHLAPLLALGGLRGVNLFSHSLLRK